MEPRFVVVEKPGSGLCASAGPDSEPMKRCVLLIESEDLDEEPRRVEALSSGGPSGGPSGEPIKRQLRGDHHGNFTDKLGVPWAVNAHRNQ